MSVIAEVRVDGNEFELGRALDPPDGTHLELASTGSDVTDALPVWACGPDADGLEATALRGGPVEAVRAVEEFGDRTLYTLEWNGDGDHLLVALERAGGELLECRAEDDLWELHLRFADAAALASFREACREREVPVAVERLFVPGSTDEGYGLTDRQRETLTMAVASGYYDIPRRTTTQELGEELGISDQAVTERLRRAIRNLVGNTLLAGR